MKTTLISDNQSLVSAQFNSGTPIATYDDGFGPLWILRNSMGVQGIIRAQTWEDAYEIAEDELFDDCDLTLEEIIKEYGFRREHVKMIHDPVAGWREVVESDYSNNGRIPEFASIRWETRETLDPDAWGENELFCEAYGFRPNGMRDHSKPMSRIYAKDLNGESLDTLTAELVADLGIVLNIESNEKNTMTLQIKTPSGFQIEARGPMGRQLPVLGTHDGELWIYSVDCDLHVIAAPLALEACVIARNAGCKMTGSLYPLTAETAKTFGVSIWLSTTA